jgi:uncharacterized repeat protein (TIGR03803 family)
MNQSNVLRAVATILLGLCTISSSFGVGAKQTTLFRFPDLNTGVYPYGGVIVDASGVVYGTTHEGGAHNFGTVFKLVPPGNKEQSWTESVLYSFSGGDDGEYPYTALTFDDSGNLYGTAYRGQYGTATIFELSSDW